MLCLDTVVGREGGRPAVLRNDASLDQALRLLKKEGVEGVMVDV
jgi:hypothetical protein